MAKKSGKKEAMAMPKSAFKRVDMEVTVYLAPDHLKNVELGVREYLNEQIMQYDDTLGGVILGYTKLKANSSAGVILDDSPFLQLPVSVSYLVFAPRVGHPLVGQVNKVGADHVGLLVNGTFNASIAKAELGKNVYNAKKESWSHGNEEIVIGSQVAFRVLGIEALTEVISISGSFLSVVAGPSEEAEVSVKEEIEENEVEEEEEEEEEVEPVKKEKKEKNKEEKSGKKRKVKEESTEEVTETTKSEKKKRRV